MLKPSLNRARLAQERDWAGRCYRPLDGTQWRSRANLGGMSGGPINEAVLRPGIEPHRLGWSLRQRGITLDWLREHPDAAARCVDIVGPELMEVLLRDWYFLARDEQLPPPADPKFWLYLAGRGSGKTRAGAEWTREKIKSGHVRGGLIAPTAADARDVMIEGESGLLAVCIDGDVTHRGEPLGRPTYEPSKRRVTWANGAQVAVYSADEPERLRGPQHSFLWMDELAAWRRMDTFDQALFGLRIGKSPRVFISTTPRPKELVKKLHRRALDPNDPEVAMTTGSSERNARNLAPGVIEELRDMYAGTALARQELDGVVLEESEGALWTRAMLEGQRCEVMPTVADKEFYFTRIVIGVDPATTSKEGSDETGIIVAGLGVNGHAYVLADYSGKYSPASWGERVLAAFDAWQGDLVVAEANQGGDMVRHVLSGADPNMPVKLVHASRGKIARAEPIVQKYEQGKVHHVVGQANGRRPDGHLDDLEDQMVTWERLTATYSPDRIDALVWALHELMIDGRREVVTTPLRGMH